MSARRPLAVALALALALAPPASAQGSDPEYPPEFLALLPGWIEEAEAIATPEDRERPWWPEAEGFLQKAKEAEAEGRFRIALFQLETFGEIVVSHKLIEEANATRTSDVERKTFIVGRTTGMRADTQRAWSDFRETVDGYDDELRSLQAIEMVLYASDIALTGALGLSAHDDVARELPQQSGVPMGYVIALVRSTHTTGLNIGWATDMLAEAVKEEGLPPRVLEEPWANLSTAVLALPEGETPAHMRELARLGDEARNNSESLLSLAFTLAEQRALRADGMFSIFGDAESRAKDVVGDSRRGMNKQLDNTTLEEPRSYGLTGVFTSDAIDRARYANEFLEAGRGDLGTVITAWSALEHARFVTAALGQVSPVQPSTTTTTTPEETPFVGVAMLVAVGLGAALVRRKR